MFTFVPIFAAVFAFILLRERLSHGRIVALLCGMFGAVWVVLRGDPARLMDMDLVVGDAIFFAGTAGLRTRNLSRAP